MANLDKSSIFFSLNAPAHDRARVCQILGIPEVTDLGNIWASQASGEKLTNRLLLISRKESTARFKGGKYLLYLLQGGEDLLESLE